tara:strand:- start:160 stop:318 length:159 start_codon:yes stop_codon:yes gene_type:complete
VILALRAQSEILDRKEIRDFKVSRAFKAFKGIQGLLEILVRKAQLVILGRKV